MTSRSLMAADASSKVIELVEREPVVVRMSETARVAVTRMAEHDVGRLIVVQGEQRPIGIVTRSDVVAAFGAKRGLAPEGACR